MKGKIETLVLKENIVEGLLNGKGNDITEIDLREIVHAVSNHFILCTGTSNTHIESLAREVEKKVKKETGQKVWRKEGLSTAQWVILDYVDVVVHIFQKQYREFYGLEELWADAPQKSVNQ